MADAGDLPIDGISPQPPDGTDRQRHDGASPRPWLRWVAVLMLVPVAIYVCASIVVNVPASPARNRLFPLATTVLGQYFVQDWHLFGPTPGTTAQMLFVEAKVRSPDGAVHIAPSVDVEYQIDRMPRADRIMPSKIPGVVLAFQEGFADYGNILSKLQRAPKNVRGRLMNYVNKKFGADLGELDRFLSAEATDLYPGETVVSVRALFAQRPIVPYSERYMNPPPREPMQVLLQTQWMPFISHVAN